jgi:hypothetical protein
VDEPDASAAGARAAQGAIRLGGEAADAALVAVLVVRPVRRGDERRLRLRGGGGGHPSFGKLLFVLLSLYLLSLKRTPSLYLSLLRGRHRQ